MTDRQNCVLYYTHTLQNTLMSITSAYLSRIQHNIVDTLELSFRELLFRLVRTHFIIRVIFALRKNEELWCKT